LKEEQYQFVFSGNNERLDKFLVSCLPDLSRSRIQALIKAGNVLVNGQSTSKTGFDLADGQLVNVVIPATLDIGLIPEAISLDMIFENDDLMVINKPAGMVVHPGAGHDSGTLVHAALAHAPEMEGIGGELRPGVVHRLDKDTSGLILMAKNDRTHRWLQEQFRLRKVHKTYLALVDGFPPTPTGRVEASIGRDPAHRQKMSIVPADKGREAVTEYHTRERYSKHTLIEALPLTGRTHQIRLHMAFLGCPIVGDTIYGFKHSTLPLDRHFLHAYRLEIMFQGEKSPRIFEAPLPEELESLLATLQKIS
jgi:23S rRNA pseudouridine1911/1915/1917 synthase